MTGQTDGTTALYALLIGIDCYLPNRLPDGSYYPSLNGCVRDISHVREFLQRRLGVPDERILALTSTNIGAAEPPEPRAQWPTSERMIAAFRALTEMARPGDQVYVHYSGHGGRAPTTWPDLKGAAGLDEALVPVNIGDPNTPYLRDLELAHLLDTMVEKGLIVTVVLDSCHSGGATRGQGGATVRGLSVVDTTPRPARSLVAPTDELAATWRRLSGGAAATRGVKLGSGWLPQPKGYVLLAACRPAESAFEYPFDGAETNGALTYWLLDSLKQLGPGLTYALIYDRIVAKVHSQFAEQTPLLQGEGDRVIFGGEREPRPYMVNVLDVDEAGGRVLVATGQVQAMRKGAQFAIYPQRAADLGRPEERLALVEIAALGATESWAAVTKRLRPNPIEQGDRAVLLDVGTVRLRRAVRLVRQDAAPAGCDQDGALERVERALAEGGGFVRPAAAEEPADYQVAINAAGAYEIWDPAGRPFANLRPALGADDQGAAARVVQRLMHLAKYHTIQQLDNVDPMSPLARKLVVELAGWRADYDPTERPEPQPFADAAGAPTLKEGEWAFLRVKNASARVLNVTALDLAPDWSISQVYPSGEDTAFLPFDPGEEQLLPLQANLTPGAAESTDVLKVFATVGPTDFRWLELPALDRPSGPRARTRGGGPANPLEDLLAAITVDEPQTRNLNPAAYPSREWATAQVEVRVRRA